MSHGRIKDMKPCRHLTQPYFDKLGYEDIQSEKLFFCLSRPPPLRIFVLRNMRYRPPCNECL